MKFANIWRLLTKQKKHVNTLSMTLGVAVTLVLSTCYLLWHIESKQRETIIIAAGPESSLSYDIIQGLEYLLKTHDGITTKMIETRGGEQNAKLLESGLVQLAVVPANNLHGEHSRLVASLYPANYHLLVHDESGIVNFTQLKGKKIAMQAQGGTEYEAFWEVAKHYGLTEDDISVYASTDSASDWLFTRGQVDAIFRIRAPGDPSIKKIAQKINIRFIPLEQVEGIRINSPTRNSTIISKGVYHGHPPIPRQDINSIAENELLIAHKSVSANFVAELSKILFEDRKKLTNLAPMSAFIKQPKRDSEQLIPIHEGVRKFWEREDPPFLQRNADAIATVSSLFFVLFSITVWIRHNQRKKAMFEYNRKLMNLAFKIKNSKAPEELSSHHEEFDQFLIELVVATEGGKIGTEDYNTLNYTFEAVKHALSNKAQDKA